MTSRAPRRSRPAARAGRAIALVEALVGAEQARPRRGLRRDGERGHLLRARRPGELVVHEHGRGAPGPSGVRRSTRARGAPRGPGPRRRPAAAAEEDRLPAPADEERDRSARTVQQRVVAGGRGRERRTTRPSKSASDAGARYPTRTPSSSNARSIASIVARGRRRDEDALLLREHGHRLVRDRELRRRRPAAASSASRAPSRSRPSRSDGSDSSSTGRIRAQASG